jgi:iron only hydrogenase large subunit-like protein
VCYAEKTHPHVLPHLSRVKSPQALAGTLVKSVLGARLGIPAARIWHLAVMPCFDKKLEASRAELTDEAWGGEGSASQSTSTSTSTPTSSPTRDVDCVITSKEILMLAESRGIDFFKLPRTPLAPTSVFPDPVISRFLFPPAPGPWRTVPDAGPSGGNLYFVLQAAAARHPGGGARITTTRGRNADVVEYAVEAPGGAVVLRAARYYGFRNIQNLVRKLKPARPSRVLAGRTVGARRSANGSSSAGASEYAYVEVMACPGGCTNGGGQIKADDAVVVERLGLLANPGPAEHKAWLAAVDEAYFSSEEGDGDGGPEAEVGGGQKDDAAPEASDGAVVGGAISPARIRGVLAHWAASTGIPLDRLVLTTFREVVSDVGKDMTDTERAAQLAGKIGGGW